MSPRAKKTFLICLLVLGAAYRLLAAYPLELGRFAPASSALQAMHILAGERPIFYSGQAWMGPAGAYFIALLFKIFGASTLTLGLFSWVMSVLFLLGTVLLAYRLFDLDNALVVAGLFLVPIDWVMYLAGQPRAHYTTAFVLVPVIFLLTLALLRQHRAGRPLPWPAFLLGLVCGFSFWTNMAVGPAIGVSVLLLLGHLRRPFFTRVLPPWLGGWVVGFAPVIWYNLTHQAVLAGQVNAANSRKLGLIAWAFVTNAWPHFWGFTLRKVPSQPLRALFLLFVAWVSLLYLAALVRGWRKWRRGEDTLGYQLVFGYFLLHLAVTAASSYGKRFTEGTPLSYVVTLYTVAFSIPALVLPGLSRRAKALVLLPFAVFVGNNLVANAAYPKKFVATLRDRGLAAVVRYPNERNPFLAYCRERGLTAGYLGGSFRGGKAKYQNFPLNLEAFGVATFADPASERYVASALAADAARRVFWVDAVPGYLALIGATSRTQRVGEFTVHDDFRTELREQALIPSRVVEASENRLLAPFAADGNADTQWSAAYRAGGEATLDLAFDQPRQLREIVLFPPDVHRSPSRFAVEVSDDGSAWRRVHEVTGGAPVFWSVWHPFLKMAKPRMEVVLPRAETARFCRLRFAVGGSKAGVALREVRFLEDGPVIDPAAWEREIEAVVRAVAERGKEATVVGDHWFSDSFRLQGFATAFISNESINDCGQKNPDVETPAPLDFSRPLALIAPRPFLAATERLLAGRGVSFTRADFPHHVVFWTRPARVEPPLTWNGLELNELGRRSGKRIGLPWPRLQEYVPGAQPSGLRFGKEFELTATAVARDRERRLVRLDFEVMPLRETRQDWWFFVHLRDAGGRTVAVGDFPMKQLDFPTSRWAPGSAVLLEQTIAVPPEVDGKLSATIGIWNPRWHRRLRLPDGQSETVIWRE
jgi:hypothetical protein